MLTTLMKPYKAANIKHAFDNAIEFQDALWHLPIYMGFKVIININKFSDVKYVKT